MIKNLRCEKKELPFEKYVLIIGNTYKHKMIEETIEFVSETKDNYIVIGAKDTGYLKKYLWLYIRNTNR